MNEIHETFGGNLVHTYCLILPIPTGHSSSCKPSLLIHKLSLLCCPLNSPFPQKLTQMQASVTSQSLALRMNQDVMKGSYNIGLLTCAVAVLSSLPSLPEWMSTMGAIQLLCPVRIATH
jgi:hypothetical protein